MAHLPPGHNLDAAKRSDDFGELPSLDRDQRSELTVCLVPDVDPQRRWVLHLSHQPSLHSGIRPVHRQPALDNMAVGETEPAVPGRSAQSDMVSAALDRSGSAAGQSQCVGDVDFVDLVVRSAVCPRNPRGHHQQERWKREDEDGGERIVQHGCPDGQHQRRQCKFDLVTMSEESLTKV